MYLTGHVVCERRGGPKKMSNLKEKIKAAQLDLIKELGIDKLEKEKQEKMVVEIGEILQQKIATRVSEELPEDKIEEFKTVLERASEKPELVDFFLEKNVPNFQDLILEEIGEYKKNALNFVNKAINNKENVSEDQKKEEEDEEDKKRKEVHQSVEENKDSLVEEKETDPKNKIGISKNEAEIKPELNLKTEEDNNNLNDVKDLNSKENKELESQLNLDLDLDKKAEELGRENASKTEVKEIDENFNKNSDHISKEETQDYREALNLKESPIEVKEHKESNKSDENKSSNLDALEKEQFENEAKILEENKINSDIIEGEELDLSNELEKMRNSNKED